MKLYAAIVALSVFMSWYTVHAEEVQLQEAPWGTAMIYRESSEANRINKKWTLQWQVFGLGSNGTAQGGFVAGHHFDRNSILQIEAGSGGTTTQGLFSSSKYDFRGSAVGVHYKKFLGNSFYVKAGMDYREVSYSRDYVFSSVHSEFNGNSLNAALVIGNQWQWENFTLGCDWIGYSLPISSNVTSDSLSTTDSYYRQSLNDDETAYLKSGFLQALRFYVGATF